MNKIVYILNINNLPHLLFENDKMKYFDVDNNKSLKVINDYLLNKINFNSMTISNEKELIYNNEKYSITILELIGVDNIKDNSSIRGFMNLDYNEFSYLDLKLLNLFYSYECRYNNLNEIALNKDEETYTKRNTVMSIIVAVLCSIFLVSNDRFSYFGVSIPIIILTISLFGFIAIGNIKKINLTGSYLLLTSILLSFTYAIYTNPLIRTINLFLIPMSLITGLFMIKYPELNINIADLRSIIIPNSTIGIFYYSHISMIPKAFKRRKLPNINTSKYSGFIKGLLISIPLLIILIPLLCSADKFFADIAINILNSISDSFFNFSIQGLCLKLIVCSLVFIYFYYLFSNFNCSLVFKYTKKTKSLDKNMVNTVLSLINILYLIFTFIQVKHLFIKSNTSNLTPEEYSNYARSGFFQLLLVVIVNVLIILYFKNKTKNALTFVLNTLMTIISINMSFTSFYKMRLYIINYGITRLRFMTSVFILFIIITLILIAISIWKKINLLKYCIIVGSILYLCVNFCNMDKIIAKYNLSLMGNDVDIEYLSKLSLDCNEIILDAYNDGEITGSSYRYYLQKRIPTSNWYEYNYYNNKYM